MCFKTSVASIENHPEPPDIISVWLVTGLLPEFQKTREALFFWKEELRWY